MPIDELPDVAPAAACRIAVLVALALERAALDRSLRGARAPISVHQSGPGAAHAVLAANAALARGANALVSVGFAGGLTAEQSPGTVVLPARVIGSDGVRYASDTPWRAALSAALGAGFRVSAADLVSVPAAITTPAEKIRIGRETGAGAADMETAAAAAVAAQAGVRFVAIRVVVDGCGDTLPTDVERFVDARGESRLGPVVAAALRPSEWARLATVTRRYWTARGVLERLAARLAALEYCRGILAVAGHASRGVTDAA